MSKLSNKKVYVVYRDNCLKGITIARPDGTAKDSHKVVVDAVIMTKREAEKYVNANNNEMPKFKPELTKRQFYDQTGGQEGTYKSYINYKKYMWVTQNKISKWYMKKTKLVK